MVDALEDDDRIVCKQTHGDRERAESHQIEVLTYEIERRNRECERQRNAAGQYPDAASGSEHPEKQRHREHHADEEIAPQVGTDDVHDMTLVIDADPVHPCGS